MSLTTKILQAAMASPEHVFFGWMPHVDGIRVYAHRANTDYQGGGHTYIIDEVVYLDSDNADERLADVLAKIEELNHA